MSKKRMNDVDESLALRKEIEAIYKKHNPKKLADLDSLMEKCIGKEKILLEKVKEKYLGKNNRNRKPWIFVLKNYSKDDKFYNQHVEKSLSKDIKTILDGLAHAIGGECTEVIKRDGQRQLIVRENPDRSSSDFYCTARNNVDAIMPTVEKMQQVIHSRYQYTRNGKCSAHLHTDEFERRKNEKKRDQLQKKRRDKKNRKSARF